MWSEVGPEMEGLEPIQSTGTAEAPPANESSAVPAKVQARSGPLMDRGAHAHAHLDSCLVSIAPLRQPRPPERPRREWIALGSAQPGLPRRISPGAPGRGAIAHRAAPRGERHWRPRRGIRGEDGAFGTRPALWPAQKQKGKRAEGKKTTLTASTSRGASRSRSRSLLGGNWSEPPTGNTWRCASNCPRA